VFYSQAHEDRIRGLLHDRAKDIDIEILKEIDSTNDELKRQAVNGQSEIKLLIAESQTKGKGTKGRSFFSPANTGCYMSFLLRPSYSAEECSLLTTAAATATALAIEKVTSKKAQIKWVNDIYIDRKKAAGILTEAAFKKDGKSIDYIIIGIGVNISPPEGGFPAEIENIATSIITDEPLYIKNKLIAEIANSLIFYYKSLKNKLFIEEYKKRLFFLGEEITVTQGNESYKATAVDIDSMCHLIVKTSDGEEKILHSGEISIKLN
jgi:BirA family biotin operon repressor/biotin-[acetyl-CoA-carboxylase] ligase